MNSKTILALASPVTQSREAVKQLIAYQTHGQEPSEMPLFYRLGAEMVLVLSNKKDAFYVTTPKTCSCPAAAYHPGQPCKHSREHFPEATKPEQPMTSSNIPPHSKLPENPVRAIPSMLPDLHDTTDREAAYHSIAEDKAMWPAEA
jgi:hypothetical protein